MRYLFLRFLKAVSHTFYKHDTRWVTPPPEPPWDDLRLLAFLNHTSLFEWLFVAAAPNHLLRSISKRAVVPIAQQTYDRPLVGSFYNTILPEVVPISRERDHTWEDIIRRVSPSSMLLLAPEGRMMREGGLDKNGNPMTVRGGVADLLRAIPDGRMLLAYSGGLHHVQVPGQHIPNILRPVRMSLEVLDIAEYKASLGVDPARKSFKKAVTIDLDRRRDSLRPPTPPAPWPKGTWGKDAGD